MIIAGAACLAILFVEVANVPLWIKKVLWGDQAYRHRIKPLDCSPCLSFWLAGFFSIFFHKNPLVVPCIGAISSILAVLIIKHMSK